MGSPFHDPTCLLQLCVVLDNVYFSQDSLRCFDFAVSFAKCLTTSELCAKQEKDENFKFYNLDYRS